MKILQKAFMAAALLFAGTSAAFAQAYSGERKFDGVHKNEINGSLFFGENVVTGFYFGENAIYTHHFTPRWSISAGQQIQFLKQVYAIDVTGTYRIPILKKTNLYIDGRVMYSRYQRWKVDEPVVNLSAYLETTYFDLRWGWSFISYHKLDVKEEYKKFTTSSYTEPLVMTIQLGINIRPRNHPWNLGLFIRNFDQYYYENWNINWGLRFHCTLPLDMKLFSELNVRPAGSISQLATRYETSLKVGLKYVW